MDASICANKLIFEQWDRNKRKEEKRSWGKVQKIHFYKVDNQLLELWSKDYQKELNVEAIINTSNMEEVVLDHILLGQSIHYLYYLRTIWNKMTNTRLKD